MLLFPSQKGNIVLVDRQEFENLEFMLKNGMISEKAYQCHKTALNNQHKKLHQTNLSLIDLEKLSIIKAFKFSFSPISFISTFIFLLIASTVLVALFRIIWGRPECFYQLVYFIENKKIQNGVGFYLIITLAYAFWQALWFSFFSYFSFTSVKQVYGSFSLKRYFFKSFLLLVSSYIWFSSIIKIWSNFVIHVLNQQPGISNIFQLKPDQLPQALLYLIPICAISYIFTVITMVLTGPIRLRLVSKAFLYGLKKPIYIIKFWIGVTLNIFLVGILIYYTQNTFLPLIKTGYNALINAKSITSLSSMLGIVVAYVFTYILVPKKHSLWIKLSVLFVIPSSIIYSMFAHQLSIHATIIFFLFMHLIWVYFYIAFFFTIQSISFWNNLLTQMWCCTMKGEYVTHKTSKKRRF